VRRGVTVLYVVITHRPAHEVALHLSFLAEALPGRRVAVAYGGPAETFPAIEARDKVFVEDPTLRGEMDRQSLNEVLLRTWAAFVAPDPAIDAISLIEHDLVPTGQAFDREIVRVLDATGAGVLGQNFTSRSHTNWPHALRVQDDAELTALLRDISVRDEHHPSVWGGTGAGMILTRAALEAFALQPRHLVRFAELYVPTVLHHLGFRVGDLARDSRLVDHSRFRPVYDADELDRLPREGVLAVHPVKDYGLLAKVRELGGRG
jgi:hypothetical protein